MGEREALLAHLDDLRKTGDVLCADWYNEALDDVRRWVGEDDG